MTSTGIFRPTPSNGLSFRNRTLANRAKARKPALDARVKLDAFAEALSQHGDVKLASTTIGTSYQYGRQLLKKLKAELGWQAV